MRRARCTGGFSFRSTVVTAALGLQEAIKLAKRYGSRLRLINVVDELPVVSSPVAAATADIIIAQLRSAGESILEDGVAAARDAGVQVDSKLLEAMGGRRACTSCGKPRRGLPT
jgi:nucleotide-binding universal stress UspA family protein